MGPSYFSNLKPVMDKTPGSKCFYNQLNTIDFSKRRRKKKKSGEMAIACHPPNFFR